MLYQAYQLQSDLISPLRLAAQHLSASLWLRDTEGSLMRKLAAACDVVSRLRLTHSRPPYQIHAVAVGEREYPVVEETTLTLPFAKHPQRGLPAEEGGFVPTKNRRNRGEGKPA